MDSENIQMDVTTASDVKDIKGTIIGNDGSYKARSTTTACRGNSNQ